MASHLLSRDTTHPHRDMLPTHTTHRDILHSNNSSNNSPHIQVPTEEMLLDMASPSNMDTVDQEVIPRLEAMDRRHHPAGTEREWNGAKGRDESNVLGHSSLIRCEL